MVDMSVQGISLNDTRYALQFREDDKEALDAVNGILNEIECCMYEDPSDEDNIAEILSVVKAYIRGFFQYSDVMSILNDEYPWMTWPWDYKYLKLVVR